MMDIRTYWTAVLAQDCDAIRSWFLPEGWVNWHNTNEHFTVEEFIRANCEYPGEWMGTVERVEAVGNLLITATHVYSVDLKHRYHVVSFICMKDGKILSIDEYWGDDDDPPQWRQDMDIGSTIR